MQKLMITRVALITVAGAMLLGYARAQQSPAAGAPSAPAAKPQNSPAAKTQQAPSAKPKNAPGTKTGQSQAPKSQTPLALKTDKDKASYALGMNLGTSLHRQSVEVDPAILLRGLKDALAAGKTAMTEDEMRTALTQLQNEMRKRAQEKAQLAGEANKKEGEVFLAANKNNAGVVTLPSGLQYKILTDGTGPKPTANDSVVCNYRGTLINGTEFDSSYKRGQPATFPVTGVIKGWTEALQLMPVGSKWQLFVPPGLAYGERGGGPLIGPNATLIFEVELISIQAKDQK